MCFNKWKWRMSCAENKDKSTTTFKKGEMNREHFICLSHPLWPSNQCPSYLICDFDPNHK